MQWALTMLLSLLFIPVNLAVLFSFSCFAPVFSLKKEPVFFGIGIFAFTAVYFKFSQLFDKPYILAHELSHALAGLARGNKIKKIKVGSKSGYVAFGSKTDFWTSIAPYILPFYSIAAALIYFLLSLLADMGPWRPFFLCLQGFLISFHAVNTLSVMSSGVQSDFKKTKSVFFSYMLVIFLNMLLIAILIKLLFPHSADLTLFLRKSVNNFIDIIGYAVFYARKIYFAAKGLK